MSRNRTSEFREKLDKKAATVRTAHPTAKPQATGQLEFVQRVTVTQAQAAHWLERNTHNRTVSDDVVMRYARDMKEGRWVENGETIKLATDGTILDGQHRLYAVLEAAVPVKMLVVSNLPVAVQDTVDTGKARSFGDVLAIHGTAYSSAVAGGARWWHWYLNERARHSEPRMYSHGELSATVEKQTPWLPEAVQTMYGSTKAIKLARPSILAFVFSGAWRTDAERAMAWLTALDNGVGLTARNPAFTLRERLIAFSQAKARVPNIIVATFVLKSWNVYSKGGSYSHYKMTEGEKFPEFYLLNEPTLNLRTRAVKGAK